MEVMPSGPFFLGMVVSPMRGKTVVHHVRLDVFTVFKHGASIFLDIHFVEVSG